jgi:hypothetical protein
MAGHTIVWDPERRLLEFSLVGSIVNTEFARFITDFKKAIQDAGPGPFYVLADITKSGVQTPEAAIETEELMRWSAENGMVRAVNLLPATTVHAMQMRRLVTGAGANSKILASTDRADALRKLLA